MTVSDVIKIIAEHFGWSGALVALGFSALIWIWKARASIRIDAGDRYFWLGFTKKPSRSKPTKREPRR